MKKILFSFVSLALVFTLAACGSSSNGNSVTYNTIMEPPELNSVLTTTTGSGDVLRHVVEGLVGLNEKDEPVPAIAKSWDISSDGTKYTFHLRDDAKWSNGEKVTANDFVFAFNLLFTPKTAAPYAGTWAPFIVGAQDVLDAAAAKKSDAEISDLLKKVGYKAVDDYTFEIQTTGNYPYFLGMMAFYSFLPINEKGFNDVGGLDKYGKEVDAIITNGAFNFKTWDHESKLVFEKNPEYWNKDKIKLDEITFMVIADSNAALNEFEAGTLDITNLSGEQFVQYTKDKKEINSFDDASSWYLLYNTKDKNLGNAKVRKALTLALDAQQFIDKVVQNSSGVANSFTPNGIVNGTFASQVGDLMNRPTTADYSSVVKMFEDGLKEAGIDKAKFKTDIIVDDSTSGKLYGAYVQGQLKKVLGIDVSVSQMTYQARVEKMQNKDFEIVFAGWGPDYNDPMTFLSMNETKNGNNHADWSNAKYDELAEKARKELDSAKRTAYMVEMEKILADEMPLGYIYNRSVPYVVSDRVSNVIRTGFSNIDLRFAEVK